METYAATQSQSRSRPVRALRQARRAVATLFFVNGAVLASWVPGIPVVQQRLGLSTGELGVALLGMPVGALLAMPTAGWLTSRMGSRRVAIGGAILLCAVLPLPALASNLALLFLALVALGASNGAMDVAMNAQGVVVEREYKRSIMASFHGLYSVGGLAGAAVSGVVASVGLALVPRLVAAALLLCAIVALATRGLVGGELGQGDTHDGAADGAARAERAAAPAFARPTKALLGLGAIAFCSLLGEGAMADWSAVYLRQNLHTDAAFAAAGFAAFSLAMATGRLTGDALTRRLGAVTILRVSGGLAALGLGLSLLVAMPAIAIAGFACVGLGLSSIVPLIISAAGRSRSLPPGVAIAGVTTTGYVGFLVGPPLIGILAESVSLRGALGVVVVLSGLIVVLARNAAVPAVSGKHP